MNFPFFIARRYLFSKKSTHAINIISLISVVGVAVATMALVVTLSVFNGFHDLVASFFTAFDPQLKVSPAQGKTVSGDHPTLARIRQLPEVEVAMETIEDQALATYGDRQAVVTIKGVEDSFDRLTHIRDILVGDGDFNIGMTDVAYGILGIRVADMLGTGYRYSNTITVYAPKREGQLDMTRQEEGFVSDELFSPGVLFCVRQAKYDKSYIVTNIGFAQRLFGQQGRVTALELRLKAGTDFNAAKRKIKALAGDEFKVEDRYEQQGDTFRVMKVEKLIGYIFLTFILVVACFNIVGSISMLIIDKKDDVATLRHLGANARQIERIFLFEGRIIATIGAIAGIAVGLALCWLQQTYGLVGLGRSSGSFVVDAYPVSVHPTDIVAVLVTVIAVGYLSVWYPVRYFAKRLL